MNPRNLIACALMLPALASVAFAGYLFGSGATSAKYTDPLLCLLIGTILAVAALWLNYAMPTNQPNQHTRQRDSGFSLVQLMVVICIAAIIMGMTMAGLSRSFRETTKPTIDDKMREAAVIKMYEDAGINGNDVYLVTAKAEWARRGFAWSDPSKPYTAENVAAELESLFPTTGPTPPFQVPAWTSKQALIDMGLTEPDPKAAFGMNK